MNAFACSLALTAGIAFSGPPPSTERVETIMQDDAALLYRPRAQVRRSLKRMARLGVDRVRITASWRQLAPHREWKIRPFFDAVDSSQYDSRTLRKLDQAIKGARAEGMQVMLDLGFFAPRWAVTRPGRGGRNVWRPSPRELARFSRALAERYSGGFADPADRKRKLPAVRLWTTWNEPNHRVFLRPHWERVGGSWLPMTPHIYRRLHNAGYDQVKRASPKNRVLIGGLASFGDRGRGPARGIGPLRFTRELACVDSRLRPLRRPECRGFEPLRADGFAMHPYSFQTPPGEVDPIADRVQIGELSKLTGLLDGLEGRGRLAQKLPLYLTEYGYQSNPPDPRGVDPAVHARYSGQALELALRSREVRSFPQFLLYDIEPDLSKPRGSLARQGALGRRRGGRCRVPRLRPREPVVEPARPRVALPPGLACALAALSPRLPVAAHRAVAGDAALTWGHAAAVEGALDLEHHPPGPLRAHQRPHGRWPDSPVPARRGAQADLHSKRSLRGRLHPHRGYAVTGAATDLMLLTVPFVMYGIFRVLFLIHHHGTLTEEPAVVIWRDRPLLVCVLLWGVCAAIIVAATGAVPDPA